MTSAPKISVIIPSYNYARYLPECIASLLAQTFDDWEAVVIDDGSTDNTAEVAEALIQGSGGKVRYTRVENGGVARARNIGCEIARGEFLLPLDADDLLTPDALEKFLGALLSSGRYGYSYSALENYQCLPGEKKSWLPGPFFQRWILRENNAACTGLFRRELFLSGVRYEELIHEDWDLWLQIVSRGLEGAYIPEPLLRYRSHPEGRHSTNRHMYYLTYIQEVQRHPNLYAAQLQQIAEQGLLNMPEALSKPTITFLITEADSQFYQLRGNLFELAREMIQQGFFVSAVGTFASPPMLAGLAVLGVSPESGLEERADKLAMLGPRIIVVHDGGARGSLLLRASENVALSVSVADRHDPYAGLDLTETESGFALSDRGENQRSVQVDDLVSVLLSKANIEGNLFLKRQNKARAAVRRISSKAMEKPVESFRPGAVILAGDSVDQTNAPAVKRSRELSRPFTLATTNTVHEGSLSSEANFTGMQLTDTPAWSRSAAVSRAMAASALTGCEWICVLEADVFLPEAVIDAAGTYSAEVSDVALLPFSVRRLAPGQEFNHLKEGASARERVDFPAEVECGGFFVSRSWLEKIGGPVSPLRTLEAMFLELEYRAKRTGRTICWLPDGAYRAWSVPEDAIEWQRYDEALIKAWKGSDACAREWPTGGMPEQIVFDSVPKPDFSGFFQHEMFAREKTTEILGGELIRERLCRSLFELGMILIQRNQASVARIVLEDALALNFDFIEGWLGLGHACVLTGAIQLAGHCSAKAESLSPGDARVRELYLGIREIIGG